MKAKLVITLLCFITSLIGYAQDHNFLITDDGRLVWQKVFDTEFSEEELNEAFKNEEKIISFQSQEGVASFHLMGITPPISTMGYSRGTLPIYVCTSDVACDVIIQYKEGKYRVTAEHIILEANTTGALRMLGSETPIETYAVRDGEFSRGI